MYDLEEKMWETPRILLESKLGYEYDDMCKDPDDVEAHMETLRTWLRRADEHIKEIENLSTNMWFDHEKNRRFRRATYQEAERLLGLHYGGVE